MKQDYSSLLSPLIEKVWQEPLLSQLTSRKIISANYAELSQSIPDKVILIKEVFPKSALNEICANYEPYLAELQIAPFLGTLGDAVICIGYGPQNQGRIYYFDFDFGEFPLGDDQLDAFLNKLEVA